MLQIRHAILSEKKKVYRWLCLSDTTSMHMGEPDYPESPVPDWDQFQSDFEDFYFKKDGDDRGSVMIIENDNEEIGCLCYTCFHLKIRRAELDIWLKAKKYCGNGCGSQAVKRLLEYLSDTKGINKFLIRPSEKNKNAIAAYNKAGFVRPPDRKKAVEEYLREEYMELYGVGDYGFESTAVLVKEY